MTWWHFVLLSLSVVALVLPKSKYLRAWQFEILVVACLLLSVAVFAPKAFAQVPPEAGRYRAELVRAAHSQWGLDAPIAALAAQVHQESGWNPRAVSQVGAKGMAQFMPATATWWCDVNGIPTAECQPANPTWALRALVGYDKWLWDRIPERFNAHDRLWAAMRAYNGGLGHWQKEAALATGKTREAIDAACGRARRSALHCPENLGYPQRILITLQPRYLDWGPGV